MTLTELFTNIANAIRAKTGSTEPIIAEDFPSAIEAIEGGVTVPDLIPITWESVNTNSFGNDTIYKIRLTYLTVNENNTLTTIITPYDTSGSINVVPDTFIHVESEEIINPEGAWGEGTYYPRISDANGYLPFVSTGGADSSMCVFDISDFENHIAFNVS